MSVLISDDYMAIEPQHAEAVSKMLAEAWKDPRLPSKQFRLAVQPELERFRQGLPVEPYDSAVDALRLIPMEPGWTLLDVGAGSGFYSEVFRIAGLDVQYHGVDFSKDFVALGRTFFPGISLNIGDAQCLAYPDDWFDIVFSSGCLMHIFDYAAALAEMVRVSRRWIVLNRTPVREERSNVYFVKKAYGRPCLEIHFSEERLHRLLEDRGLKMKALQMLASGHRTYVLEKQRYELPEPYASNPNV